MDGAIGEDKELAPSAQLGVAISRSFSMMITSGSHAQQLQSSTNLEMQGGPVSRTGGFRAWEDHFPSQVGYC